MTKAQAAALLTAIEGQGLACSVNLTFPQPGVEQWTVTIPETQPLTGTQLGQLAAYCANNGLTLSGTFSYLGVS